MVQDLQAQEIDKNFRLQKITEDSLQMQSEIMVLNKEKERFIIEREEFEQQMSQIEVIEQEIGQLTQEKMDLIEANRRLTTQLEMTNQEKSTLDQQGIQLKRDKEELTREVHDLRDRL